MAVVLITLALIGLTALFWWRNSNRKGANNIQKFLEPNAPRNTVIIHQYGPAPFVPSVSPFVMKLETFLRVAKIPYENRFDKRRGPRGKIPWLQYNDDIIADSQICIEYVNKLFQVDLNKGLTPQEKALGHMTRKTFEEWVYWAMVMWRLVYNTKATLYRIMRLPGVILWYLKRVATSRAKAQGIGGRTEEELFHMIKQDLSSLDQILDDKKFLFGDKVIDVTEFDCAIFGQLCELAWQTPGAGIHEMIQEKHPKLVAYCQRMKETFWPDWDERLMKLTSPKAASKLPSTETTRATSLKSKQNDGILASNLSFDLKAFDTSISNANVNSNIGLGNGINM